MACGVGFTNQLVAARLALASNRPRKTCSEQAQYALSAADSSSLENSG
jgi:hypothetical protein